MTGQVVRVGDMAPDLALPCQTGERIRLSDLWAQGPVVLYFYPKDQTPGCTREACAFRDDHEAFRRQGAQVVGISADDVDSHHRFAADHALPFLLLSDRDGTARRRFGVPRTLGVLPGRATYVIGGDGIVRHIFSSQLQTARHVTEALVALDGLESGLETDCGL